MVLTRFQEKFLILTKVLHTAPGQFDLAPSWMTSPWCGLPKKTCSTSSTRYASYTRSRLIGKATNIWAWILTLIAKTAMSLFQCQNMYPSYSTECDQMASKEPAPLVSTSPLTTTTPLPTVPPSTHHRWSLIKTRNSFKAS